jgi:hypothetical protein
MDASEPHFEQRVLTLPEVFVYKVPPLRSASGHRAEDWNLENPIFTGCIRCFQVFHRFADVCDEFVRVVCFCYYFL